MVDHFTRLAQAYPTKNKTAQTATDRLFIGFILKFGYPSKLHHDQDQEFEKLTVQISHTTVWTLEDLSISPTMQPCRAIESEYATLGEKEKLNWTDHLPHVIHGYNYTKHEATGFLPHYLMYGRHPPVDLLFGLLTENAKTPHGYSNK